MVAEGDTAFHSGAWDPTTGSIDGQLDVPWEPHHDVITDEDQVQIYELVLGDVNGDPTTLLERAYAHLKDNRLTPQGFVSNHPVGDTTAVYGHAAFDSNFNLTSDGTEGTGADKVYYQIPESLFGQNIEVTCKVWYQSIPPKWVAPMLELEGDSLIDGFRQLYTEFIPTPELVGYASMTADLTSVLETPERDLELTAGPNPTRNGQVLVQSPTGTIGNWVLYDAAGRRVQNGETSASRLTLELPASGQYVLKSNVGSVRLIRQ
jgi:hypothetical protein